MRLRPLPGTRPYGIVGGGTDRVSVFFMSGPRARTREWPKKRIE
jgi:hypothetical protein